MRKLMRWIQYSCARWWLLRKLDRLHVPRHVSEPLVNHILDERFTVL